MDSVRASPSPCVTEQPPRTMHPQYYLADHVHVCCTGRFCIFLDINSDRYFSINTEAFAELEPSIFGCEVTTPLDSRRTGWPITSVAMQLADELVAAKVLRLTAERTHSVRRIALTTPTQDVRSMVRNQTDPRPRAGIWAWYSLLYAQYLLKAQPLREILTLAARRASASQSLADEHYVRRVVDLTRSFSALRPLFPRDYLCLFDSLALVLYLAKHGTGGDWVFAVREEPFDAHCWVQAGSVVLNDFADRVAMYTPIMAL